MTQDAVQAATTGGRPVRINLALQGGGAHGAFTWGVLERLLEDDAIEIAAISGTSAGALNGAALKAGLLAGGRAGAVAALADLWAQVGTVGDWRVQSWMQPFAPFMAAVGQAVESVMPVSPQGLAAQLVSPYAHGVAYRNPLRRVVERFRYDRVCADEGPRLFISATNLRTGKIRIFSGAEISTDAILASACLPTLFQAVEITDPATGEAEAFWDGGYSGNPAIFPLFEAGLPDDIVVVNINPLRREGIPRTPFEIQNRINEISFNSSLLREMRAIHFVRKLLAEGAIARGTMKDVRLHMIADDALMNDLSASSKVAPTPYLLERLRGAGQAAADSFLAAHRADLGARGSIDLPAMFN